ncbi:MAG TPA: hypothetical protein VKK31_18465 [Thermoanaerobaculia bacterium]|nr:hypothetical protein [Thermoanaerobaculia bacterium]
MANRTRREWLQIWFWEMGLVFFVLGSMYYLSQILFRPIPGGKDGPAAGDLATLFSGASSLALILFSLLLAFAAIIGWQSLKSDVDQVKIKAEAVLTETVKASAENQKRSADLESSMTTRLANLERSTTERIAGLEATQTAKFAGLDADIKEKTRQLEQKTHQLEEEIRGRVHSVMGNMIGTLHTDPTIDEQSPENQDYLAEAVYFSTKGYERLKALPGNGKYVALNNLVYFSTLLRTQARRADLLRQARELLAVGREFEHLPYSTPYLMTYARTILVYGSDRDEIQEARGTVQEILAKGGLPNRLEREARYIETSLSAKLQEGIAS